MSFGTHTNCRRRCVRAVILLHLLSIFHHTLPSSAKLQTESCICNVEHHDMSWSCKSPCKSSCMSTSVWSPFPYNGRPFRGNVTGHSSPVTFSSSRCHWAGARLAVTGDLYDVSVVTCRLCIAQPQHYLFSAALALCCATHCAVLRVRLHCVCTALSWHC